MTTEYKMGRGESKMFTHTVTSVAGALVDLTNAKIYFDVYDLSGTRVLTKRSAAAGGSTAQIEILTQSGGTLGKFTLKILTTDSDIAQVARWADCFVVTAANPAEYLKVAEHAPFYIAGEDPPSFA
jgi:hypothetical protein